MVSQLLPLGARFAVKATFLRFEPSGFGVSVDDASGSCIVRPRQVSQVPLKIGDRVILTYEWNFREAQRGGNGGFSRTAGLGADLISVTPDTTPMQANLPLGDTSINQNAQKAR